MRRKKRFPSWSGIRKLSFDEVQNQPAGATGDIPACDRNLSGNKLLLRRDYFLVRSHVLHGEVIVIARDPEAAKSAPAGYVVYTLSELAEVRDLDSEDLRQIHRAKKLLGGKVCSLR